MSMDLPLFVKNTLIGIVDGIQEAQSHLKESGAIVVPSALRYNTKSFTSQGYTSDGKVSNSIDFDLAVTIAKDSNATGKIGVISGFFNMGAQGNAKMSNVEVSRIKFTIPIIYPYGA